MAINKKQQRFVEEYLVDMNATQAAIRSGYSKKTSYSHGQRLLKNVEIQRAIQKANSERSKRTEIKSDNVLQEIAKLGFANIKNIFDEEGKLIPIHLLPPEVAASLVEVTERVIKSDGDSQVIERKYKLADKKASLELLGKHLKLFTEKHELSGPDGGPIEIPQLVFHAVDSEYEPNKS